MKAAFALLAGALALSACETSPPPQYGPATGPGANGFSETQIESDRFRVSYHLAGGPSGRAADLALLRAAELTLAHGDDWFAVTQRGFENPARNGGNGPRVSLGVGGASFGRHTAIGTGIGFTFGGPAYGDDGATAFLEVRMAKGAKPADPNAYDAHDVERALSPRP